MQIRSSANQLAKLLALDAQTPSFSLKTRKTKLFEWLFQQFRDASHQNILQP